MLLRSGTWIQSGDASCLLSSTPSSGQPLRYMAGHKVTAKAGTARLSSLPNTATYQPKRQRLTTDMVSLPEQTTATSAIQCKKLFQLTIDRLFRYSLNRDHSRLLVQNRKTKQTEVWEADQNGSFVKSFAFDCNVLGQYGGQQDPNFLFVLHNDDADAANPIHVYERKAPGDWVKAQELTVDDLVRDPDHRLRKLEWVYDARIAHSDDSSCVVCLTKGRYGSILGRGVDGLWMNRGSCMKYETAIFSADDNHLALALNGDAGDGELVLMSKSADGCWLETGGIRLGFGEWQLAFSPDSRHFIAWFEHTGEHHEIKYYADYGRYNFFVMLFSLDDQGLWAEKQRITKYTSKLKAKCPLKAEFSPDGKHLAICAKLHFEVWTLNEDNGWTLALQPTPYLKYRVRCRNSSVINFSADSSVLVVVNDESGEVWALQDSGRWECQHKFGHQRTFWPRISPDAKTIICETEPCKRGLWQQKNGLWTWQDVKAHIYHPRFNCDGSILAFVDQDDESLVLMAPDRHGDWQEKSRLPFQREVKRFQFHPSGRALQVTCKGNVEDEKPGWPFRGLGEAEELSFWGLVATDSCSRH